jgi:ADP-heptose:LPS heptosyltransferase
MERVLIIKMSALGDVVLATPQIEAILAWHRDAEVWLLAGPDTAPLFAFHPRLKTAVLDRSSWFGENSLWGRNRWIRRMGFSALYDLQGNRTSRRLTAAAGSAPVRAGTQPKGCYTHHPEKPYTRDMPVHVFDRLNETLASAGLPLPKPEGSLVPGPDDLRAVRGFLAEQGLKSKGFFLMHAGASPDWPSKRWPRERARDFLRVLAEKGMPCVLVGAGADRELNLWLAEQGGLDATGRFSVLGLYALGKEARFALCMDSGPMHILSAAGLPVCTLYGPTSPKRTCGLGQAERVVCLDWPCSPCYKGVCPPGKGHGCLAAITPETVLARLGDVV